MELRVSAARGTKRPSSDANPSMWFLTDSTMSNLIRDYDWAATDLGALEQWPTEWLVSLSNMICTAFPTVLFLGPGMRVIYNDAYLPHMGSKHPRALGQRGDGVWPEIWDTVGSTLRRVLNTGKPSWDADKRLLVNRHGYLEESYWTYSYSCIKERSGNTAGLYAVVEETTSRFLSERRMATAQLFTSHATGINTRTQVISALELALRENRDDVPFALLYLCSNQSEYADAATAQSLMLHVRVRVRKGLQETPLEAFLTGDGCTMKEVPLPEKVAALVESEPGAPPASSVFCIPLLLDTETGYGGCSI